MEAAKIVRFYKLCKSWQSWHIAVYKSLAAFLGLLINQFLYYYWFFTNIKMSKDSSAKY